MVLNNPDVISSPEARSTKVKITFVSGTSPESRKLSESSTDKAYFVRGKASLPDGREIEDVVFMAPEQRHVEELIPSFGQTNIMVPRLAFASDGRNSTYFVDTRPWVDDKYKGANKNVVSMVDLKKPSKEKSPPQEPVDPKTQAQNVAAERARQLREIIEANGREMKRVIRRSVPLTWEELQQRARDENPYSLSEIENMGDRFEVEEGFRWLETSLVHAQEKARTAEEISPWELAEIKAAIQDKKNLALFISGIQDRIPETKINIFAPEDEERRAMTIDQRMNTFVTEIKPTFEQLRSAGRLDANMQLRFSPLKH